LAFIRTIAGTIDRGHTGGVIGRTPSSETRERRECAAENEGRSRRSRQRPAHQQQRRTRQCPQHALEIAYVLYREPLDGIVGRQHVALDECGGQRLVVRFDQRWTSESEIDHGRSTKSVVQSLRPMQCIEILVDIEIFVRHSQTAKMPPRASRILTPVGPVDNDHIDC
jgi:hypothetical protein